MKNIKKELLETTNKIEKNPLKRDILILGIDKDINVKEISSKAAIAFNPLNGEILYEKNINEKMSVASLTKLISSIVVIETFSIQEVIDASTENIPKQ